MNRRPTPETDAFFFRTDIDWDMEVDFARRLEIERNELRSDLEFRRGLFQLQEQQLNEVRAERDKQHEDADAFLDRWSKAQERAIDAERERDEWKKKFIQQNKDLGCEMMDPNGTIWDYAKKLQDDIAGWETKWKCAVDMAAIAENERDELKQQLDAAIMLGKLQERRHERELEQVREQYRLSSVCRNLLLENQQLKECRQSPTNNQ